MSDREILEELLQEKRRQDTVRYIKYAVWGILLIALIVLAAIYVPKIVTLYNEVQSAMEEVDQATEQIDLTMQKINQTLQTLQEDYDSVKSAGAQALEDAAETLNGVLETLRNFGIFR